MPTRQTTVRPARAKPIAASTPVARKVVLPEPAVVAPTSVKSTKPGKTPKLRRKPVRDSFTMPEADFSLIATLKARALASKREAKKSELLRAGLHALAALDARGLVAALSQLEPIKIGRPKAGH